jgi:hypothetical protein
LRFARNDNEMDPGLATAKRFAKTSAQTAYFAQFDNDL